MNFKEQHAAWLAQFTPEEQAEKAARYEAFKAEAAAIEAELNAMRAERGKNGATVSILETVGSCALGPIIPNPKAVRLEENMAYYYRLYYDPAVNNYCSWADVGRK